MKDTAALKNGDKVVASSWIVKVKITKSVNSRYSNGCILSSISIVSDVLLQVLLVL